VNVAELCACVRKVAASNEAIYPVGGGTMLDLGYTPTRPGVAVDLRSLDQVIDYPARDMTITVRAGITIARLQEILHAERQQLPVDIPLPEKATVGGAIATNASGPRRYGLGTLRDYVIGISIVNDEGQEIKAGGRVVKNVAGYDLMKLYTGSLGTLGIITQVTLKLKPESEASSLLVVPVNLDQAATILDAMSATRTRPVCLDLLDPSACKRIAECYGFNFPGRGLSWNLAIGFDGSSEAVRWQVDQIKQELPIELRASLRECDGGEHVLLCANLRDFPLWHEATVSFKANLLSSATVDFCRRAAVLTPAPMLQAHAGNGIVIGHFKELTLERARASLEALGTLAVKAKGNLIVTRCPTEWKTVLPIWGRSTADRAVMKAVKAKLDPNHIFNPGRFVDGI
jgi:glycolate oxidase FAD binding subunit